MALLLMLVTKSTLMAQRWHPEVSASLLTLHMKPKRAPLD
jgi:hypothetical protein